MPRPRQVGNQDLPPHLHSNCKNGKTYYRYTMPDGQRVGLGRDKKEAISTALTLNAELSRNPDLLNQILHKRDIKEQVKNPIPTMDYASEKFWERLLTMKYADSVRKNQRQNLNRYKKLWGEKRVNDVTHQDVVDFLNPLSAHAYIKHKALLVNMWQFFLHQAWAKDNWPANTMDAVLPEKARLPITYTDLMVIRAISPDYVQRSIDLALHSLQRREDLSKMQRDIVNLTANTITVYQGKSEHYAKPIWIEVDMHDELRDAVVACMTSPHSFRCPYLLHYVPKKMTQEVKAKPHFMMMTPQFISNSFAEFRDKSGIFDHLEPEQKPTYHEIRALGEFMVKNKYGKEYAKALAGHSTDAMYEHYVGRHEIAKPQRISFRDQMKLSF